jgi:multimeric flavodoxin WrbA
MKIVGINGSPRSDGNTRSMIMKVFESLQQQGIETELIQVGATDIRGCIACYRCVQNKDRKCAVKNDCFNDIFPKMAAADGIIIGSPTYFTDVTAETKALIDRAGFVARANGQLFRHKAGAAVIALRRGGGIHAFDTINHLFLITQMFIVGSTYWNLGFGRNKGEVENDTEGMENMADLGNSMALLVKRMSGITG